MRSKKKDYAMGECCPWERSSFSYNGLSSHNPLIEAVRGDFELTPEEREAMAAQIKAQYKARDAIRNPLYRQYQLDENADYYRARARKNAATYRKKNPDKCRESHWRQGQKVKKSGVYSCATCNVTCPTRQGLLGVWWCYCVVFGELVAD
ncbi:Heat shock protein ssb1 [Clarireedia jacksonii]